MSAIQVRPAKPADRDAWDAFVAQRPEGDPLQGWAWAEAGQAVGEHWERRLAVGSDDRIRGVMQVYVRPTHLGRTIHYAPHGPVWEREAADSAEVLGRLLREGRRMGRAARGVVMKVDPRTRYGGGPDALGDRLDVESRLRGAGLKPAHFFLQAPTTRIVDLLDGGESLMSTFVPDARTRVRRAVKEGVQTELDREGAPHVLDAFQELLVETSERQGFEIRRSREFIAALADQLAAQGDWFTVLARFEGRPIAGIIGPRTGDRAFYLYAASTRDPAMDRKRGGYAAMAALMRAHAEAGTRTLDLWGVREPGDESIDPSWQGFTSFKTRFGGRPLRHPRTFDVVLDPFWFRIRDWRERYLDARAARLSRAAAEPARDG